MLTSEIVTKVTVEGAFDTAASDTSAATVLGWVNEMYRQMVGDAEWLRAETSLGVTVANQAIYDLPDTVVHVKRLAINGNSRWKIVDAEELVDLKWGGGALFGSPGVVAEIYDEASSKQKLELWPAPTAAGYSIVALASLLPAALTAAGPDTTPAIPVDLHEALADGAIGLGRLRVDERQDLAQPYLEKFQAAVGKLVKRRRSRLQEGAWQASVGGRR